MPSSGILRRAVLVRTDLSEEHSAPIIRVTRIGEVTYETAVLTGTTLSQKTAFFSVIIHVCALTQAVSYYSYIFALYVSYSEKKGLQWKIHVMYELAARRLCEHGKLYYTLTGKRLLTSC
jgi:NRPS condensation-like uncharacterized protein